jgi:DNA-binding NarL/FixJ family response regulator
MIKSLIVEDNAEFRGFLKALLLQRFPGGLVNEANDASAALRLLGEVQHDIILLDLGLPGSVNGLALTAQIRQKGRLPPILVISNYVLPEYQLEAARLGADWFLPKVGSTSAEIISAVERLIVIGVAGGSES